MEAYPSFTPTPWCVTHPPSPSLQSFSVSVPNKVEQYLNYTYGADWRIPDPQRNGYGSGMSYCHDQDPNVVG